VTITLDAVEGLPEIQPGDDVAALVTRHAGSVRSGDVVVVAQKVVSKAEGRLRDLSTVSASPRARRLAKHLAQDPRFVQLVLDESVRIVRQDRILIVETPHGFICANAGVDRSNVDGADVVTLLPLDPDGSARALRNRIGEIGGADVAVIISDTFGRPWRIGQVNAALGVFGMAAVVDHRGEPDDFGTPLQSTLIAVADEIAAATGLVMGKARRVPAVVVRGIDGVDGRSGSGRELIRPPELDLFR